MINFIKQFLNSTTDTQIRLLNIIFVQKLFCNRAYQNQYIMVIKILNSKELLESLILVNNLKR